MLHPVFSFFNGCEGVGGCMYGCLPCCKTRPKGAARRTGTSCQATAATKSCTHPKKLRKAGASCQATAATKTCTHPKGSAKRDLYAKPTASRETAQLWVYAAPRPLFREAGLTHPLCSKERQHGGTECHATHPSAAAQGAHG